MSTQPNWKAELITSGLPLQADAAAVLAKAGYRISPDFKFRRSHGRTIRESSVALRAATSVPFNGPGKPGVALDLLVECRQQPSDVVWLFLPDPGRPRAAAPPEPAAVRLVDKFCPYAVGSDAGAGLDAPMPSCLKGLRIDLQAARHEEGAGLTGKHRRDRDGLALGLTRLQYALPRLLISAVTMLVEGPPNRNVPWLFCPILLTSARLLAAEQSIDAERVGRADDLSEFTTEVPFLAVRREYGPDFASHCMREFRPLESLQQHENTLNVERRRAGHFREDAELPGALIEALIAADASWLDRLFTQFVVCTRASLGDLLDAVEAVAKSAASARTELP